MIGDNYCGDTDDAKVSTIDDAIDTDDPKQKILMILIQVEQPVEIFNVYFDIKEWQHDFDEAKLYFHNPRKKTIARESI